MRIFAYCLIGEDGVAAMIGSPAEAAAFKSKYQTLGVVHMRRAR